MSTEFIYLGILALLTAANSIVLWVLWQALKNLRERTDKWHAGQQRQGREISQHRYSIALLSQTMKNKENAAKRKKNNNGTGSADLEEDEIVLSDEDVEAEILALNNTDSDGNITELPSSSDASDKMKDSEILEFVKKAVRNNQIALALQPIVTLPDRQVGYYEVFSRIQVPHQGYIPAQKYLSIAKNNNLLGVLDNMLMLRCLQLLKDKAEKAENIEFFLNTNPQTFINKDYLSSLVKFLAANPRLSSKLIFEMSQEDWLNLSTSVKTVMDNLSLLGCRFSMDQIAILGMDMARMLKQNISFVKLEANLLIKEIDSSGNTDRIKRIKSGLDAQRINVILEKVENEKQLVTLHDMRPDFGQGYLFGAPDIVA